MNVDIFRVVSSFAVLLLSLSVHETAHAWTAARLGDSTAREMGRISLNPWVHIDFFGTILLPLMSLYSGLFVFGWAKPVRVTKANLRNPRRDHALVAAAGPISNILMAGGLFVFLFALKSLSPAMGLLVNQGARQLTSDGTLLGPLIAMAYFGIWINLVLAIFNLIPVSPLDGGWILAALLPETLARPLERLQYGGFGIVILIGLVYLGVPGYLFYPVWGTVLSFLTY